MLKGIIKAKDDGKPIAYVSIVHADKPSGTYSNENGEFEIKISSNESLVFSSIGFKQIKLTYSEILAMGNVILLEGDIVELENVTVTAKRIKERNWVENFGFHNSKKKSRLVAKTPGFQIATLIENTNKKPGYVEHILLNVVSTGKSKIRLHLYSTEKFPEESTELLKKNVVVDVGRKKGIQKIDVSKYGINFPAEGLVVGIEFLGNIKNNDNLSIENGVEIETKMFLSQGDMQRNTWIGFMGKKFEREIYSKIYNTNCNAMVGLSVRFYENNGY